MSLVRRTNACHCRDHGAEGDRPDPRTHCGARGGRDHSSRPAVSERSAALSSRLERILCAPPKPLAPRTRESDSRPSPSRRRHPRRVSTIACPRPCAAPVRSCIQPILVARADRGLIRPISHWTVCCSRRTGSARIAYANLQPCSFRNGRSASKYLIRWRARRDSNSRPPGSWRGARIPKSYYISVGYGSAPCYENLRSGAIGP